LNSPDLFKGKCRKINDGKVEGEALITKDRINFYLVDPESGNIIEEGHGLEGEKIAGKIIIFPGDKGSSVVQLDGLYQLAMKGNKPMALIAEELSTVLVSNAIIMEIPLVCDVDKEFYEIVKNGDTVAIDTEEETVTIGARPL
jgi:predicted aconitase with swiveling domain